MASIRSKVRGDGTTAYRVFFRMGDRDSAQTCLTFDDEAMAEMFRDAVNKLGVPRALELHRIERTPTRRAGNTLTVEQWLTTHVDHLTGLRQATLEQYRSYIRNDIGPVIGAIPIAQLDDHDIGAWVQQLEESGAKPKTISNKHAFLSGALAAAVPKHIPANPAAGGRKLPGGDGDAHEMLFLTRPQFAKLLAEVTPAWQPMIEFLVASGCRLGEATALRPDDVNLDESTVRIARAWNRSSDGFKIGTTKTKRSKRTINVPAAVLAKLDYTGEWLFTSPGHGGRSSGAPVRPDNLRRNVWYPAVARAKLDPAPRVHDLRHTCASWLIQAGVPLVVVSRHLGHESVEITSQVYVHLDRSSFETVADVMGTALTPVPPADGGV